MIIIYLFHLIIYIKLLNIFKFYINSSNEIIDFCPLLLLPDHLISLDLRI